MTSCIVEGCGKEAGHSFPNFPFEGMTTDLCCEHAQQAVFGAVFQQLKEIGVRVAGIEKQLRLRRLPRAPQKPEKDAPPPLPWPAPSPWPHQPPPGWMRCEVGGLRFEARNGKLTARAE